MIKAIYVLVLLALALLGIGMSTYEVKKVERRLRVV